MVNMFDPSLESLRPMGQARAVKKLVLQGVLVCASFVPLKFAFGSGILESQVRPDRADRCSAGGDNHRWDPC